MMFAGFIRRASSAILGSSDDECEIDISSSCRRSSPVRGVDIATDDGEIIYCKNNVCVHPPVPLRSDAEHRPGYLVIKMHNEEGSHPTLILTWIPNTSLKKNPRSIENRTSTLSSPCRSTRSSACPSPVWRPSSRNSLPAALSFFSDGSSLRRPSLSSSDAMPSKGNSAVPFPQTNNRSLNPAPSSEASSNHRALPSPDHSTTSDSSMVIGPAEVREALEAMITDLNDIVTDDKPVVDKTVELYKSGLQEVLHENPTPSRKNDLRLVLNHATRSCTNTDHDYVNPPDISVTRHGNFDDGSDTSTTSNRDPSSVPSSPTDHDLQATFSSRPDLSSYYMEGTPESLAAVHKLHFPEYTGIQPGGGFDALSPNQTTRQSCSYFSVDLAQMRSLRLFFSNRECTRGQLVIASRESQYKILHFHHGGLDRLACELEKWDLFVAAQAAKGDPFCPYRQFSISRPQITQEECHPEEGQYSLVDDQVWASYLNEDGQIEEEFLLRKAFNLNRAIFFGGLDIGIRKAVWPFLLHYYPFLSTYDEREQIRNDRFLEYQAIRKKRETMAESDREAFWRNIECTVEKDVVRTDRSNPFFAGNDNPNLEIMRNILLNYAVYNPTMGYTQGMSDLLAPLLTEVQDEPDTFWCFVGLMLRTIFISSPKDNDMDKHLNFIRELIRLMLPKFYAHLQAHHDAMELLFCHRWILLCFKREFADGDALRMWESCWAHYQTDYFHLFLCVAIMAIYSDDVIEQAMNPDEMLLYFSSLSVHMNGELVLRKARGLLYQFRQMPRIPCTVHGLCEMCGPGMWDSGHVPVVQCIGHDEAGCSNGGVVQSL